MKTTSFSTLAALTSASQSSNPILPSGDYYVLGTGPNTGGYHWNGSYLSANGSGNSTSILTNAGIPLTSAYTVTGTDLGNIILCNASFNISVPVDSTTNFSAGNGSSLSLLPLNATTNSNSFVPASLSVSILGTPPPSTQYVTVTIIWIAVNTWMYL